MSRFAAAIFLFLFFGIVCLPALVIMIDGIDLNLGADPSPSQAVEREEKIEKSPEDIYINVLHHPQGELKEMHLEKYVAGVVSAEMPASFGKEALKAQAVIARTYALAQIREGGGRGCDRHPSADICTQAEHCQAWESQEEARDKWASRQQESNWNKITAAVKDTKNMVVTCQEKPIDAVFHSTCGGHTDNSEEVWSTISTYLKGVECGYCSHSPWSTHKVTYTLEEFSRLVSRFPKAQPASSYLQPSFTVLDSSSGDRLRNVRLNNLSLTGHELRDLLDLPSTRVNWSVEGNSIVFKTRGYGHGVGLCQYGADGMSQEGYSYKEILQYYYQGVEVVPIQRP